jgi:hypothetical protein
MEPGVLRFRVNSRASNVVIGVLMIPAIGLLAGAFTWFEGGRVGLGVAAAAGFLACAAGAGLAGRRLQREIEVTDDEVRELARGEVTAIRWDEPHALTVDERAVRRTGVTVTGHARVVVTAAGRRIAFSTPTAAGMLGVAAKLPGGKELATPGAAIARMIECSAAAAARAPDADG